ncbi:membrane protein [Gordonia terrae C-6]|uniref:Membrane protein n=1 Tax=Gordonia terrae C-6 TaxID=1316928 RepID=R7Y606_9ACTN|nr:membrane protein [Gordonia terrae]EON31456.1 membrane protein [Gordonia terrae C-6]
MATRKGSLDAVSLLGGGLAATGVAHFVAPQVFASITAPVFPDDTTTWTYRNGASETAIGLALVLPRTRRLGLIGLAGYLGFLGYRAALARG